MIEGTEHRLPKTPMRMGSPFSEASTPWSESSTLPLTPSTPSKPLSSIELDSWSRPEPMSLEERKTYVLDNLSKFLPTLHKSLSKVYSHMSDRTADKCWLHPSPPTSSAYDRRAAGVIKTAVQLRNPSRQRLNFNLGLAAILTTTTLTPEQRAGYIDDNWHLSHLCGNWTCLNPAHMTLESGSINVARNWCFRMKMGCEHSPKCMKDLKLDKLPGVELTRAAIRLRSETPAAPAAVPAPGSSKVRRPSLMPPSSPAPPFRDELRDAVSSARRLDQSATAAVPAWRSPEARQPQVPLSPSFPPPRAGIEIGDAAFPTQSAPSPPPAPAPTPTPAHAPSRAAPSATIAATRPSSASTRAAPSATVAATAPASRVPRSTVPLLPSSPAPRPSAEADMSAGRYRPWYMQPFPSWTGWH